ncbi:MAG: glutathione S-transferase family protein [Myxococcota bacterium]
MVSILIVVAVVTGLGWYWVERRQRKTGSPRGGFAQDVTLDYEREFELYHNALSLCSKKVRVCLAELGIDYRAHPIDLIETGRYENLSRRFLRVNPGATVPVLVHDGHPVYESHEQIVYLGEHAESDVRLIPADPDARADMQRWIDNSSLVGDDPLAHVAESAGSCVPALTFPLFATMMVEIPFTRLVEGFLFHPYKIRPLLFAMMKVRGIEGFPKDARISGLMRRACKHLHVHLDALEAQLAEAGGPWILGADFSLADVSWLVILERLNEAEWISGFLQGRPRCSAYWQSLIERDSYRQAIVEHSHPILERGRERLRAAKQKSPELAELLSAG